MSRVKGLGHAIYIGCGASKDYLGLSIGCFSLGAPEALTPTQLTTQDSKPSARGTRGCLGRSRVI